MFWGYHHLRKHPYWGIFFQNLLEMQTAPASVELEDLEDELVSFWGPVSLQG